MLLSAYDSLSQRYWCDFLKGRCRNVSWSEIALPPRYFSWRMRGSPLSFKAQASELLNRDYDLLIATSTVDLSVIQSIYPQLRDVPSILYFHENQFAYPSDNSPKHLIDWQMVNLYAALRADKLVFNSQYNRLTFLDGVKNLLKKMPDLVPKDIVETLEAKSAFLPVPIPEATNKSRIRPISEPVSILWNHRWEWDKNPELLLAIVDYLKTADLSFELIVTGQQFRHVPEAIHDLKLKHSDVIKHIGYVKNKADYRNWLKQSDFVLSTAIHEFQGIAIMEAVQAGCLPLLPNRLSYPEFFDNRFLYSTSGDLKKQAISAVDTLLRLINDSPESPKLTVYTENSLGKQYEKMLIETAHLKP